VSVVRDNDTELSRGFAFVTFENEEMASKAIQDMNRRELPTVCPPHGRLVLKKAEKSRQQKEWEKVLLLKTSLHTSLYSSLYTSLYSSLYTSLYSSPHTSLYTSLHTHSQKFSRYANFPVSLTFKLRKSGKKLSLSKVLSIVLSLLSLKSSLYSASKVGSGRSV
jgi:RNA recognition motif-containing protein